MKVLQSQENHAKLLTVNDGYLVCPHCRYPRLMRIPPTAEARGIVAYCRKCKHETILDIVKGQSYESQS